MNIGITGASGYIGSRVMYDAIKKGHEIVGIDNNYVGQIHEITNNKIINTDIRKLEQLRCLSNCHVILHLAAVSSVQTCKKHPNLAYRTNVTGTQNIAWLCYKHSIPLIFITSMAIFGNPGTFPIKEEHKKNPLNLYGLTKLIGMKNVQLFAGDNNPAYIFNLANVYGKHKIGQKIITKGTVVNKFIEQSKNNEKMTVYKPGTQARDFIHVKDVSNIVVDSIDRLAKDTSVRLYNLASGKSYSVLDIAGIVKDEAHARGYETDIEMTDNPRNETLVSDFHVDTTKLETELGLTPHITMKEGIQDTFSSEID